MRKKLLTAALAATMVVGSVFSAFAADVDASKTYEGGQLIDGKAAWNTADGDNYLISSTPVTVAFTNDPFTDSADNGNGDKIAPEYDNWDNFVIETVASDAAKGVSMRADNYSWTYGDAAATPTVVGEISWTDWDAFHDMCLANKNVTVTATKTNDTTVEFLIAYGSAETVKYTVTYADGVPADLRFHVGADGGAITVNSVTYGSATPGDDTNNSGGTTDATTAAGTPTSKAPNTGDASTTATLLLAVAAVGASMVVLATKKSKVTE